MVAQLSLYSSCLTCDQGYTPHSQPYTLDEHYNNSWWKTTDFTIEGSVLIWTASRQHMEFAVEKIPQGENANIPFVATRPAYVQSFDWDLGYRLSFDHLLRGGWNLFVEGSYIEIAGDQNVSSNVLQIPPSLSYVIRPSSETSDLTPPGLIRASCKVTHYSVDAVIGYASCTEYVEYTPFVGLKAIGIEQNIDVAYDVLSDLSDPLGNTHWTSDLSGIGLQIGGKATLSNCGPLQIYTLVSGSVIPSRAENRQHHTVIARIQPSSSSLSSRTSYSNSSEKTDTCVFGARIGAGLQWQMSVLCVHCNLLAGYEFHYYANVPTQRQFAPLGTLSSMDSTAGFYEGSGTPIGFHGATAGVEIIF